MRHDVGQAPLALAGADAARAGAAHQHADFGVLDQADAMLESAARPRGDWTLGHGAILRSRMQRRAGGAARRVGWHAEGAGVRQVERAGQPVGNTGAVGEAAVGRDAQACMAGELVPDQVARAAGGGVPGKKVECRWHCRNVQRGLVDRVDQTMEILVRSRVFAHVHISPRRQTPPACATASGHFFCVIGAALAFCPCADTAVAAVPPCSSGTPR
ncbi:hypothetical protein D9M69_366650 [compost metagenome]